MYKHYLFYCSEDLIMPTNLRVIAKAGVAGACSVYLVFFGIFLLLPGAVMIGMSNDKNFQDEFFEDSNRYKI